MMETFYVLQENCRIHREGEHLKLTQSGKMLSTIPIVGLKTLVIFDSINLTVPAMDLLLYNGIDIIYQSKWGKVKGRVMSAKSGGAVVRLAQYATFTNTDRRLELAKAIVAGKINNQMTVVRKYQYNNTLHKYDDHISTLNRFLERLDNAVNIEEAIGVEGISARYYWDTFRHSLKNPVFTRREYRPSPDYVNALLNLGYAFLSNEITTCLIAKHFDTEIGFLHSIHYGRNSLALDIMEEFRAPFIDVWIRAMLNKNQLKDEHFHVANEDWRLTDEGFRKFCGLYHERVPFWRNKFSEQAGKLKASLMEGKSYEPYCE